MTTCSAPARRAETAASNAALPPPMTTMSHFSVRKRYSSILFLGFDSGEGHIVLDHGVRHREQALGNVRAQIGAADRASDRQAAPISLGTIFLVFHEALIGRAQDLEAIGRNPGRPQK